MFDHQVIRTEPLYTMELQKEIDPLRLEHNRSMQQQQQDRVVREHEDSECDAEQAVSKHFEESLRRANVSICFFYHL